MKHLSLVVYFLVLAFPALLQNQHMNWHFGFGVGLNFSSGNPVSFTGSAISTTESCASMSDANGNLLFYTNGIDVWNANNTVMPNGAGLLGSKSSQCIIIPKPGNPGKYYIVATDGLENECLNGITYSEVDMSLLNGNGNVTATKNIQLNAPSGEWITAIKHANCVDTWIITHGKNPNNFFLAYLVNSSGIDPTPVTTNLGIPVPLSGMGAGVMRPNREGTKIAMSRPNAGGSIELIDFNKATGIATGISNLYTGLGSGFGLEFSRSGNRLYSTQTNDTQCIVFQYDMTAANISASRTQVSPPLSFIGDGGFLQMAPNDKIYVNYNSFAAVDYIGVINNPELSGTACGFVEDAVSIGTSATLGLPWYYDSDFLQQSQLELGPDLQICEGNTVLLSNNSVNIPGAAYIWSDGSTNPTLSVSEAGTFWVQYQLSPCLPAIDSVTITFDTTQISHTVGDTSGCAPFTIQVAGTGPPDISEWIWNMGNGEIIHTQNASVSYTTPGIYTISLTALTAGNCLVQDSVLIHAEAFPLPTADFSFQPTIIEPHVPILFTDQSTGIITDWSWQINNQPASTYPECSYTLQGYYTLTVSLTVTNSDGCSDEKKVIVFKPENMVYVPNTFTPDGDQFNPVFIPIDYFGLISEFTIYDRWGEQIWSETSAPDGWNGLINGQQAPEGVYTWLITLTINNISSEQIQGHVTLVR